MLAVKVTHQPPEKDHAGGDFVFCLRTMKLMRVAGKRGVS
jgi:hypothetical protein